MQSINIYEKGIFYLGEVLSLYMENCAYFMLFILGLVYIQLKGSKRDKTIFIPASLLLILTAYNPIVAYGVNRFFDINNEYYRLFWIAPVAILIPYILVDIISSLKNTSEKTIAIVIIVAMGLFAGNFVYADGYKPIENIYQMPDELIEATSIIHGDSDVEYPKVFFEYEYNMQARQYDPKICLTIDREDYLRAVSESYPEDMIYNDDYPQYRLLALLVRGQAVEEQAFLNALESTKTEYIVLSKGNTEELFLKNAGLHVIGETANHLIYKYDLKEPYVYELIDYTDVEHKFSFRRLK